MNPAFAIGQQVGTNFAQAREKQQDVSMLDKILADSMATNDPNVLQNNIGQILKSVSPARQPQAIKLIESRIQSIAENRQRQAKQEAGFDPNLSDPLAAVKYKQDEKNSELIKYGIKPLEPQPQVQNKIGQTQQEQTFIPGMQLPEEKQYQPLPPELKNQVPPRPWFKNLTPDQLIQAQGSPYREISEPAKAAQAMQDADRKELIEFHKGSQKYDDDLRNKTQIAKSQMETFKDIEKAVDSGNVKPESLANIFKGFGNIGNKISEALLTGDQATILASIPQLLEGWKQVFGVRLSDADLKLLNDKLPSIGKSPEANKAVLKIMKKYSEMTLLRGKIATDIKKQYNNLRPLGYEDMIEERFDQMIKMVKVKDPETNKILEIPAFKLPEALEIGGILQVE